MYVVTVDQRGSRRGPDLVPELLAHYRHLPAVRPFERTAGDEVEGVFADAAAVVEVATQLAATGEWSVGIGIDDVEHPLPSSARAGRGAAFVAAREAVESAKGRRLPLRVVGPSPWCVHAQTALCLLADLLADQSDAGREAVALVGGGLTQAQAAAELGVSPQAVSLRLRSARWDLQDDTAALAGTLLLRAEEDR